MYRVFDWLGADGVRVIDRKNVFVTTLRNRTDGSLGLLAVHLAADSFPSASFRIPAPWAGGRVELLEGARWVAAPATWDGTTLTLKTDFAIMKPVVIRISK